MSRSEQVSVPTIGEKPLGALDEIVDPYVLDGTCDERLWVPQAPNVWFRPLVFGVSHGYYVNVARVRASGVVSRHRHIGPVHGLVLKGRWHYLERDWWAEQGSYVFEPPGDVHTLEVPDGVQEMQTVFHVIGGYVYVDPNGEPVGFEDVFSKLEMTRKHYASVGLGSEVIDQIVR